MPNGVATALRRRNIDVRTMAEARLLDMSDIELLAQCQAEGRVLMTQHRDFIRLHQGAAPSRRNSLL